MVAPRLLDYGIESVELEWKAVATRFRKQSPYWGQQVIGFQVFSMF